MYVELLVDENAIGIKAISRSDTLAASSTDHFSSILSYRIGTSYNQSNNTTNISNYINLNSISSIKENHFIIDGSVYGIGTNNSDTQIYSALYERDMHGYRFAAGMMDTWSIQSVASLNGLNSSKIYGLSYGNLSNTTVYNNSLSLTPINVFLPNAGTVQVYRDGRLLSIQNFPLGSHEVDTSTLPSGSYSVEIKTFVNGEEINSNIAQVNKTFGTKSLQPGKLNWQVFGGMLKYNQLSYRDLSAVERENLKRDARGWLLGAAFNKDYTWLNGTSFRSSVYGFSNNESNDQNLVAELATNVAITQSFSVNWQTLVASDATFRNILTTNFSLPKKLGTVWGSREYTDVGNKLVIEKRNYYSLGTGLNLNQLYEKLGYLSVSYNKDLRSKTDYMSAEYSQYLFKFKYGDVQLRTGVQRNSTQYDNGQGSQTNNDKYIYLDLRMPFSRWFTGGLSSRNDNLSATAAYRQSFNDGLIRNVGADISKVVSTKGQSSSSKDWAISGNMGYQHEYNSGSLSANIYGSNYSANYSGQGTIAYAAKQLALGATTLNSGVMINTGLRDNGKMSAIINGRTHQLSGMRNFIPLSAYQTYTIELANDQKSLDSVNIVRGRTNKVTLYPGNVSVLNPEIQQMVTVFGRIYYPSGELAKHVNINNHIGKTVTDENGEFAIDVDKRYPILTLIERDGGLCEATLDLKAKDRIVWVGELQCQVKKTSSQTNLLEARK